MERTMEKLTKIGEDNDAKDILKKVNVDDYRKAFNNALDKAWGPAVRSACLHMGTHDNEFVNELYWINTPMAHTMGTTENKIKRLLKDFPNSAYTMLTDDATALLEKFKPFAEKAQGYKERLANQILEPKVEKDPVELLPPASREAILKIKGILENRCLELRNELESSYKENLTNLLDEYVALPVSDRIKMISRVYVNRPEQVAMLQRMTKAFYNKDNEYENVEDVGARDFINKTALQSAKDTVNAYVFKHTNKLAGVIEHMPNIQDIKLNAYSSGGRIEGNLNLSFDDGRAFRVHSQIVLAESPRGLLFARYPTTFHDVKNRDDSLEGRMLSEAEMRDWSQDKNAEAGLGY